MPSTSEKTYAKNIDNLHINNELIATATALWNTPNSIITAAALVSFEDGMRIRSAAVSDAEAVKRHAVGLQIAAFKEVRSRALKIYKDARSQSLSAEFLKTLKSSLDKLRGVKISKDTPDDPATPADEGAGGHSVSQQSYAGLLKNLTQMRDDVKSNPDYETNQAENQVAGITAWIGDLQAKHDAAITAKADLADKLSDRNQHGYNDTDGILARTNAIKDYAEVVFPEGDTRLKQLKKLRFVGLKK